MMQNPYQKFMQQSVTTMTPSELLLALYDKAIIEINKAIIFIEDNNIVRAHNSIRRVKDIVDAFTSSLKVNYEITGNLASLYDYFSDRLTEANIRKDSQVLKDLLPLFTELRDAFAEASKSA